VNFRRGTIQEVNEGEGLGGKGWEGAIREKKGASRRDKEEPD